jgi:hypothetical protein
MPSVPRIAKTKDQKIEQEMGAWLHISCVRRALTDAARNQRSEQEREQEKQIWPNKTVTNRTEQKISAEKRLATETKIWSCDWKIEKFQIRQQDTELGALDLHGTVTHGPRLSRRAWPTQIDRKKKFSAQRFQGVNFSVTFWLRFTQPTGDRLIVRVTHLLSRPKAIAASWTEVAQPRNT